MQVLVIQNDPMGPPALFGAWLEAQGAGRMVVKSGTIIRSLSA